MQEANFKKILQMPQTIFSFKELMILFKTVNANQLKARLHYHVTHGDLYPVRRGLYAKNARYDRLELATRIYTPAYISFETVLVKAGIIFQYYSQIFVASYQSREIICDDTTYVFRRLKSTILINSLGIENNEHYSIASPERAFLDIIYHCKEYHFDNLEPLDWNKIYELLPIYGPNKSLKKRADRYHQSYKENRNQS